MYNRVLGSFRGQLGNDIWTYLLNISLEGHTCIRSTVKRGPTFSTLHLRMTEFLDQPISKIWAYLLQYALKHEGNL